MEKRDVMSPARKRKLEQVQRAIASREGGSRDRAADDPHHHKKTRSPPPKLVPPGESTGSTNRLLKLLDDKGPVGVVTRRVMEATTNYRPEREMAKTARVFETTELSYNVFRANLTKLYALTFSDDEFSYVKTVFDEHGDGKINGYHFMVAFTQLASIRKEREAAEVRKKEEAAARRREHEEEVRRLEAEKKMQVAADYKFTPQVQERALTKLAHAAKAFDPSHPNAPNLDGYAAAVFNAGELREMLRAVFALTLTRQELGAIMAQYGGEHNTVPAGHFIREFIKLGLDGRNKAYEEQRKLQAAMDKQAEDDKAKKALELEAKRADTIDYDFSELDEARAVEKMREAAFRYDRTHPSAQGLDGFECEALAPGLFRDLLRRTFNLVLADKEIAVLVRKFDRKRTGKVACAPFVTEFLRLGQVQRQAARVDQLKRQAAMNAAHEAEQLEKAREAEGKNPAQQALKVSYDYVEADMESAMAKLTAAAKKYDKVRGNALTSFEPYALNYTMFAAALAKTFNLTFTPKEMGHLVTLYDPKKTQEIVCKPFLTAFFLLGTTERERMRQAQIAKQREAEHAIRETQEKLKHGLGMVGKVVPPDWTYTEEDRDSALGKMTACAVSYDPNAPSALKLTSFQGLTLTPQAFKEAVRTTFNLVLKPKEHAALFRHFCRRPDDTEIDSKEFLHVFLQVGVSERHRVHKEKVEKQRRENEEREAEEKRKLLANETRLDIKVETDFTDEDRRSAVEKLNAGAEGYDRTSASAANLNAFDALIMAPGTFREALRVLFNIHVSPKELGYLVSLYAAAPALARGVEHAVDCKKFIVPFLALGKRIRFDKHAKQLEKQRELTKKARKVEEDRNAALWKGEAFRLERNLTQEDLAAALDKMTASAATIDMTHSSAPSLKSFTGGGMKPTIFRDLIKTTFNLHFNAREYSAICVEFAYDPTGGVSLGQQQGPTGHTVGAAGAGATGASAVLPENSLSAGPMALGMMPSVAASSLTAPPSAGGLPEPSLLSAPAAYAPRESQFLAPKVDLTQHELLVDSKLFLIRFAKLGTEARERARFAFLDKQRTAREDADREKARKKRLADQKLVLEVDNFFTESDRQAAVDKLIKASAKYDKNSPGCMGLEAFDAAYLTPLEFREVIKRVFGLVLTAKEFATVYKEFKNEEGNVVSQTFLTSFLRLGAEERARLKKLELEKQRRDEHHRKFAHLRKMKELEDKTVLEVTYDFTADEENAAFKKLRAAAKKYDRTHPAALGLNGFDAAELSPAEFKEMLKRTFAVTLTPPELGALIKHFDPDGTGFIESKEFLSFFIKVGLTERSKENAQKARKIRDDARDRERMEREKLAAQWAKMDQNLSFAFTPADEASAVDKLATASFKYDPNNPGPMGMTAFTCKTMPPAIFREMVKRSFNVRLTDPELAAMVTMFERPTERPKEVVCKEFVLQFMQWGIDRRHTLHVTQMEKSRHAGKKMALEAAEKKRLADEKMLGTVDFAYEKSDFDSAIGKMYAIVESYDPTHVAAPSLKGFVGSNMKPVEFKDMIMRTFLVPLTWKELGALTRHYDTTGTDTVDTKAFLTHFTKLARAQATARKRAHDDAQKASTLKQQQDAAREEAAKAKAEAERVRYTPSDEESFLAKIRDAAQELMCDSAKYIGDLQATFKNTPAFPPPTFRDTFYRIFKVKFSFPEIGVLLSIIDPNGLGIVPGPEFLRWFYRLARMEEKALVENAAAGHNRRQRHKVTLDDLRVTSPTKVTFEAFPAKLPRAGTATGLARGDGAGGATGAEEYRATARGRSVSAGRTRTAPPASTTHSHSPARGMPPPASHSKTATFTRAPSASAAAAALDGDDDDDDDDVRPVGVPLQPAALSKQQWFLPASAGAGAVHIDAQPSADPDEVPFSYVEGSYRKGAPAPLVVPDGSNLDTAAEYRRYQPPGTRGSPSPIGGGGSGGGGGGGAERPMSTAQSQRPSRSPSPDAHGISSLLGPAGAAALAVPAPLGSPTSPSAWGWGAAPGSPGEHASSRLGTASSSSQRPRRANSLPALDEAPAVPPDAHNLQDTAGGARAIAMTREERANLFLAESTPPKAAALAKVPPPGEKGKGKAGAAAGPPQVQSTASQNNSLTRRLEKLGFGTGAKGTKGGSGGGSNGGKVPEPSLLNKAATAGAGLMGLGEMQALLSPASPAAPESGPATSSSSAVATESFSLFDEGALARLKAAQEQRDRDLQEKAAHSQHAGKKKAKKGDGSIEALLAFEFKPRKKSAAGRSALPPRETWASDGPSGVSRRALERIAYRPYSFEGVKPGSPTAAAAAPAAAASAATAKKARAAAAAAAAAGDASGGAFFFPTLLATAPIVSLPPARADALVGSVDTDDEEE